MTREAGGSPFVLEQLARYAGVDRTRSHQAPTFAAMFESRLGALSLGGAPLPRDAGDLRPADGARAHLRRVRGRARQAVSRGDAPLLALHSQQRLVGAGRDLSRSDSRGARRADCARRGAPDPRTSWCRRSSRSEATTARRCSSTIGAPGITTTRRFRPGLPPRKPATALAFDRAAFFYRQALALSAGIACRPQPGEKESPTRSPTPAGRPRPPKPTCTRPPAQVTPRRVELQRRAAEQFLIGGHIDRGLDLIRSVLAGLGMRSARSPRAALLSLLWRRAAASVARAASSFHEVSTASTPMRSFAWTPAGRRRRDLAMVDVISASDFSARHLLMALDAGEPYRIARAMAIESAARGAYPTGRKLSERLVQQSKALAKSVGNPHAIALSHPGGRHQCDDGGRMEKGADVIRAGAGDPARPVRRDPRGN